jgi:hypothetical protein
MKATRLGNLAKTSGETASQRLPGITQGLGNDSARGLGNQDDADFV